nr:hypothetical protein [Candidatus Sigynarchaeota archaeon]
MARENKNSQQYEIIANIITRAFVAGGNQPLGYVALARELREARKRGEISFSKAQIDQALADLIEQGVLVKSSDGKTFELVNRKKPTIDELITENRVRRRSAQIEEVTRFHEKLVQSRSADEPADSFVPTVDNDTVPEFSIRRSCDISPEVIERARRFQIAGSLWNLILHVIESEFSHPSTRSQTFDLLEIPLRNQLPETSFFINSRLNEIFGILVDIGFIEQMPGGKDVILATNHHAIRVQFLDLLFNNRPTDIDTSGVLISIHEVNRIPFPSVISVLTVTPDGKHLIIGSRHGRINVLDIDTKAKIHEFIGIQSEIESMAISSDSKYLVTGTLKGTILVWDLVNNRLLYSIKHPVVDPESEAEITSLAITPDNKCIIVGAYNPAIAVWEMKTGRLIRTMDITMDGESIGENLVVITPDGKYIISGSFDGIVRLWDLNTGVMNHEIGRGHSDRIITTLAITSDGQAIITGNEDGVIHVWSLAGGNLLKKIDEGDGRLHSLVLTRNNEFMIYVSEDDFLKIRAFPTGNQLTRFDLESSGTTMAITPDNSMLFLEDREQSEEKIQIILKICEITWIRSRK